MKNLKGNKGKRIMAAALAVLVFFLFVAPHQLSAGEDPCVRALMECLIDAAGATIAAFLAGLAGGPIIALFAMAFVGKASVEGCVIGHCFCEKYVAI